MLFFCLVIEFAFLGKLYLNKESNLSEIYIFYTTAVISIIPILIIFLICVLKKQGFATIGFSKTNALKSFKLGIILSIIILALQGIGIYYTEASLQTNISDILFRIIYYLIFISLMEELVFRGYIGTRLYGYYKNKNISIVIVGIMCSIEHIPFKIIIAQANLIEYVLINFTNLIFYIILHIGFQYLYSRYNSIIAPLLVHFIWNFSKWLIV
ncbi:MAG: hypothetical protein K0R00_2697 [Herbinix sp.]|nr:hypothetical protein [Herbinix sp.]